MKLVATAALGVYALCALLPDRSCAQVPAQAPVQLPGGLTPEQALELLRTNPQLAAIFRQRIQQSGLTPDQIRARLVAAGYPPNMLDAYIGAGGGGDSGATPGGQEVGALQAIGLGTLDFASRLRVPDTGFVRVAGASVPADSLAAGNYVFGVDVFRRSTTQFLPILSGPVPPDYRLGPGDQLVLIITGDVQRSYTFPVERQGFILIPQVGQVFVANLTLERLRDVLYDRLGQVYSKLTRSPNASVRFDVTVASVRANQISVVGEVQQPGAYQISALGTALTALYAAGGVTGRANMRQIDIRRLGKSVATLDLYDYLLRGDTRNDIRLETGDVVFVPLHGRRVQLTGAVLRPAIYEMKEGETLVDLVRAAGGFRANALLERVAVHRILPAGQRKPGPLPRAALDVALTVAPSEEHATSGQIGQDPKPGGPAGDVVVPALPLENGDSVVVDSIGPLSSGLFVGIAGMVKKPGRYPWQQGMTLRELVTLARGPTVGAYLKEAEIGRLPADRSQGQLTQTVRAPIDSTYLFERDAAGRYIGPPGLAFPGPGAPEVPLQPYDNVLILRQPDFALPRTVYLGGEVRFPGTYALQSKGDRLLDLLDRAGGLTPQAYPNGIRFYRPVAGAGRLGIDLPRVLKDRGHRDNLVLAGGDSIDIPAYEPTVRVEGAINSPGSVTYVQGQGLDYYLNAAGGVSYRGDKGRTFVLQPNGSVRAVHKRGLLFGTSKPTPEPGAVVVVPIRDMSARSDVGTVLAGLAQVVGALTTVIVVIVTH